MLTPRRLLYRHPRGKTLGEAHARKPRQDLQRFCPADDVAPIFDVTTKHNRAHRVVDVTVDGERPPPNGEIALGL